METGTSLILIHILFVIIVLVIFVLQLLLVGWFLRIVFKVSQTERYQKQVLELLEIIKNKLKY